MAPLAELIRNRRLLWQMTRRDFRAKYAGSLIGVFWTILNPLLLLAVFTFIFTVVFKAKFGDRPGVAPSALYILAGILPWIAFADGVARSATVALENKNLITRARFPLAVLPAYPALSALIGQLAGFAAMTAIAAAVLQPPGPSIVLLPLLLILQLALAVGLALFITAAAAYVRDLIHVIPVLLLVWMYATPLFYPADLVPPRYQFVIWLNPLAHLVEAYRKVLLEGAWPEPLGLAALAASAAVILLIGSFAFQKLAPGMADRV